MTIRAGLPLAYASLQVGAVYQDDTIVTDFTGAAPVVAFDKSLTRTFATPVDISFSRPASVISVSAHAVLEFFAVGYTYDRQDSFLSLYLSVLDADDVASELAILEDMAWLTGHTAESEIAGDRTIASGEEYTAVGYRVRFVSVPTNPVGNPWIRITMQNLLLGVHPEALKAV